MPKYNSAREKKIEETRGKRNRSQDLVRISFLQPRHSKCDKDNREKRGGNETRISISKPAAPSNFDESWIFIEKFLKGGNVAVEFVQSRLVKRNLISH